MEHSKVEEEDDDEVFPTFGDSQSDYDTVSQPYTEHSPFLKQNKKSFCTTEDFQHTVIPNCPFPFRR